MVRMRLKVQALVAVAVVVAGCGRDPGSTNAPATTRPAVIAFVAASTKEAVEQIAAAFSLWRNEQVVISAEDSGRLALQIAEGAPADLFLSANENWADFLAEKGLVKDRVAF